MDLDDWLLENKVQILEFVKEMGTSFPTLQRLRSGNLPVICKLIRQIEIRTQGKVTLADLVANASCKKVPKKQYKNNRRKKNNELSPTQSLTNLS